jgi:hypothetical protein
MDRRDFIKAGAAGVLGGAAALIFPTSSPAKPEPDTFTHLDAHISAYIQPVASMFGYTTEVKLEPRAGEYTSLYKYLDEKIYDSVDFSFVEFPGISFRISRTNYWNPGAWTYAVISYANTGARRWAWYNTQLIPVSEDELFSCVKKRVTADMLHHMAAADGVIPRRKNA